MIKTKKIMDVVHIIDIEEGTEECNIHNCLCGDYIDKNERHSFKEMFEESTTCPKCIKILCRNLNEVSNMKHELMYHKSAFEMSIKIINSIIERQRYSIEVGKSKEREMAYKEGSYPFIPHSARCTFDEFRLLRNYLFNEKRWSGNNKRHNSKFLDAGCGIGNIMMFAKDLGLCPIVHGIEYSKDVHKAAKQWLGINNRVIKQHGQGGFPVKVFKGDILKFKKYSDYDIIYFYCPFSDSRLEVVFEELVEDSMKVGAVLIPRLKRGDAINEDSRFEKIQINVKTKNSWTPDVNSNIFIKVKSGMRSKSECDSVMKLYDKPIPEKYKPIFKKDKRNTTNARTITKK